MDEVNQVEKLNTVLVTGSSGFLGKAIVKELLDEQAPLQATEIRLFDLARPVMDPHPRVKFIQGDIRDIQALNEAFKGVDLVMHTAAIVDWGTHSEEEVLAVNTTGTENVIQACREAGVKYLVYTGSLDAVYGGKPLIDIDESVEYPEKHETMYCTSKYLGEKMVMEANGNGLSTCVLRPSDIYGEDDPYHMESLIDMAKGGFYVRIGNGTARTQHVYVHNIAFAHLLAGRAMLSGNTKILGNAYFITDGPGANFFKFFDAIVAGAGYKIRPKNFWIPRKIAYVMGSMSEAIAWLMRPFKKYHPKFSRFAVTYTCTTFTFSADKAKRDFGFYLKYTEEEAVQRTIEYYKALKNTQAS